jgi:hypothetical protein
LTLKKLFTLLPQIVAVIMCDTGIALLAYMDGINDSPTLSGVVLSVVSAAAAAVFKVRNCSIFNIVPADG